MNKETIRAEKIEAMLEAMLAKQDKLIDMISDAVDRNDNVKANQLSYRLHDVQNNIEYYERLI